MSDQAYTSENVPGRSVVMQRLVDGRASQPEQHWAADEIELLRRIVDCLDPPCFVRIPAGGTLHDPHGQEIYSADEEEDELLLLARPLVLDLFDEWGRSAADSSTTSEEAHDGR